VVERERFQLQLDHEKLHDALTGLANRKALEDMLARPVDGRHLRRAVVHLDLDDFKRVNDTYGHAGGDQLLRVVAGRIAACTSEADLVTRWAGDEFVVVLADRTPAEAFDVAAAMVETVSRPTILNGAVTRISASAGVAALGDDADPGADWAAELMRHADLAVYHAKASGAGSVVLFDERLGTRIRADKQVEHDLIGALEPGAEQLYLMFQPIVDVVGGRLRGIETLVRWEHPTRGSVGPDAFVPVAERSDLIVQLDQWVLESALRQAARWPEPAYPGAVPISVNLSARSLRDPGLVERVLATLERSGVAPRRLMLEITETTLITDIERASVVMHDLRSHGVLIAIDDFGTGFTSISQLRNLPIDELKIDKSFVEGLHGGHDQVLVRIINDLAHHLGIPTVAEGVETAAQQDLLAQLGCDAMQGFFVAAPMRAPELAAYAGSPVRS
jgi:diguanylate cyclase (GGDEF)-like protein